MTGNEFVLFILIALIFAVIGLLAVIVEREEESHDD
jgi:hypothetical protein